MQATVTMSATGERRTFRRIPLVCNVWQRAESARPAGPSGHGSGGLAGRTLNLSDGGALIQLTRLPEGLARRPEPGQTLELTLALPRATADTFLLEHVKLDGEVVRVLCHGNGLPPTGLAVRFENPRDLQLD